MTYTRPVTPLIAAIRETQEILSNAKSMAFLYRCIAKRASQPRVAAGGAALTEDDVASVIEALATAFPLDNTLNTARLESLWESAEARAEWADKVVLIFSNEHRLFWREGGHGYTASPFDAGVFTFEQAWKKSCHAGPEKGIEYVEVPT